MIYNSPNSIYEYKPILHPIVYIVVYPSNKHPYAVRHLVVNDCRKIWVRHLYVSSKQSKTMHSYFSRNIVKNMFPESKICTIIEWQMYPLIRFQESTVSSTVINGVSLNQHNSTFFVVLVFYKFCLPATHHEWELHYDLAVEVSVMNRLQFWIKHVSCIFWLVELQQLYKFHKYYIYNVNSAYVICIV